MDALALDVIVLAVGGVVIWAVVKSAIRSAGVIDRLDLIAKKLDALEQKRED